VLSRPSVGRRLACSLALAAAVTSSIAGCASARPTATDAIGTADDFYAAIAGADGAAACDLLAPATVEALEADADQPCAEAVLADDVGDTLTARSDPGPATATTAGRQAQVRRATDVVFLTISGTTWLVTAVGCDPRPHRPYDCVLEGA
jgi:hypothetical protein